MSKSNVNMSTPIVVFRYNGSVRMVRVERMTDTYVQGKNLHPKAKRDYSTYSRDKMQYVE